MLYHLRPRVTGQDSQRPGARFTGQRTAESESIRQPDATGTGIEPIYVMLNDPLDSGRFTRRQLQKKYKHAIDFGISDTRTNSDTLTKLRDAVEAHLSDKNTIVKGTYIREKGSNVYFNTETNNAVVIRKDGLFSTGMKLKPGMPQYKNYIEKGVLL